MPSNTTSLTIQKLETVEKAPIEETPEVEAPTDASQWKVSEQCSEVCLIADCTKENASKLCPVQCPEEVTSYTITKYNGDTDANEDEDDDDEGDDEQDEMEDDSEKSDSTDSDDMNLGDEMETTHDILEVE